MEEKVKQLKCQNCGGPLEFDPASQKMKCPYCGAETEIPPGGNKTEMSPNRDKTEIPPGGDVSRKKHMADDNSTGRQKTADFHVFSCQNCGAELLTDEFTTATFCSYCGSPSIVEERLSGERMPDYVLPFQIEKNQAIEAYRNWVKKGFLTPGIFKSQAVIEKISGLYVPFWLYDYEVFLHAEGECVRTRFSSDSENNYTHRDYFHVRRDIETSFEKIPADASEKMDDAVMDKLEPFTYDALKPFAMEYLSGYLSERYNMAAADLKKRVESRVDGYMETILKQETSLYNERHLRRETDRRLKQSHYALLPVWMLHYRYKGKVYGFAMNGQSGKIVADLPVSRGKAAGLFAGVFLALYVLFVLIGGVFL